jgi:predicted RNase H-like HicB family nuclease
MTTFIAIVQVHSDGRYTASFPDFPECSVSSLTLDEVIKRAREALLQHLEVLLEAGQTIRIPIALDAVQRTGASLFAAIDVPDDLGMVHVDLAVPALSMARIESFAGRHGLSLAALFVKAVDRWAMQDGLARDGEGVASDGPTLFDFAAPPELRVEAAAAEFGLTHEPLTNESLTSDDRADVDSNSEDDGITAELARLFDGRSGREPAVEVARRDGRAADRDSATPAIEARKP